MTADHDVVVVGAGIVGCIVARDLAVDHDVLVVDRGGVASEATGLAAGLVAPTLFYGDEPEAARHANEFFQAFDGTGQFSFTERHRLDLVESADEADAKATAADLESQGFPVEYLDAETVEERFSLLRTSEFAGAVYYDDTGWVDPYSLTMALKENAETRGASFELDTEVTEFVLEDDAVVGVETADGTLRADHVVVAAGWRTPSLVADHLELPVQPYRTQCVVLEPDEPLADDAPLGRVGSKHLYFRPEHNGDLLIGGESAAVADPERASRQADEAFKMQVATLIPDLLNGFDHAGFVNGWAGVDGATPDGRPIIDAPADAPDGLVVATGFTGLGVMTAPLAAATVRTLLTGETPPFPIDVFRLDRFESRSADFELYTTSDM